MISIVLLIVLSPIIVVGFVIGVVRLSLRIGINASEDLFRWIAN